jgi:hypothetical protein
MTTLNLIIQAVEFRFLLEEKDEGHLADIQRFCKAYDVRLVGQGTTDERGFREPMYFFSDGFGGYNIDAIKGSLKQF